MFTAFFLLAGVAFVYAAVVSTFGLPRLRLTCQPREWLFLLGVAMTAALGNWLYLIWDGR